MQGCKPETHILIILEEQIVPKGEKNAAQILRSVSPSTCQWQHPL